jgi:AraC-like DNA-binding protein
MQLTGPYPESGREARLVRVLADELQTARVAPLHLPMPQDPRLLRVARELVANPADGRTLAAWTRAAGASGRTLQRRFRAETGLGFGKWRQQVRLLRALERLAAGAAVTEVAFDLGYDSPSAFVTMFRRALGTTPGRYFARP